MSAINKNHIPIKNDHGEPHKYVLDDLAADALEAALVINRPLLVKGEPGVGKSQLAKAAAVKYGRAYLPFVVNANTEAKDLLWSFDAVARLADAQIEGTLCGNDEQSKQAARDNLALKKYIKPGVLWAALNWESAEEQYQETHFKDNSPLPNYLNAEFAKTKGVVILIDEIDKADSSVPNALLEVLGANRFQPEGLDHAIEANDDEEAIPPLIIITSNDERTLPDAFIRRCLSITLALPEKAQDQVDYLVNHALPSFPKLNIQLSANENEEAETVLQAAAKQLVADRAEAKEKHINPLPGQAEYFDLLRGLSCLQKEGEDVKALIQSLARFTSQKMLGNQ
jgi:MoxR-like ATPase